MYLLMYIIYIQEDNKSNFEFEYYFHCKFATFYFSFIYFITILYNTFFIYSRKIFIITKEKASDEDAILVLKYSNYLIRMKDNLFIPKSLLYYVLKS